MARVVAKSRVSMFASGFHRVILMDLGLLIGLLAYQMGSATVNAQGPDDGKLYLDQKEWEVKAIARDATLNSAFCESLDGCSAACSRAACHPVIGGAHDLQCTSVGNELNNMCPSGACTDKLVDYSRSFVILPAPVSTKLSTEVAQDICLQRRLDSTFKNVSSSSSYSLVYFGSSSGVFRSFPGRESSEDECTSLDPRRRAWYRNGISVSKEVKILVDIANSMGNPVTVEYSRPPTTSYLDVAKSIALALLHTFSPQDYVEVLSFDSGKVTSLGGPILVNSLYDYPNLSGSIELAALVTNVSKLAASPITAALSDLNGAIRKAVSSFNQPQSLKIVIVLSNGLFVVNSTNFPALNLLNNQAKLMVYKLPTIDDGGDPFLLKTSLQKDICSVNGSFESLDALATANPLYSMRSYFTYLARVQLTAMGGNVTWSTLFASFSQDQKAITPTYPAFGSDGLLIGVAGIDVIIDNLANPLRTSVYQDLIRRSVGTLQAPANISMTCSYQNAPANSVCPSVNPPDSSAICPRTDFSSTLGDRSCCGTCTGNKKPQSIRILQQISTVVIMETILVVFVSIIAIGVRIFYKRTRRFLPVEEDLFDLNLCERVVRIIEDLVNGGGSLKRKSTRNLLNERQCMDLSSKLSKSIKNIREILFNCRASAVLFKPALEKLYLDLAKAKLLVEKCGEEDWCRASVFQSQNEIAFQEILLDVGLCYNTIYEQARSTSEDRNLPEDLRQSSVFKPAPQRDVHEDQLELRKRLEALANGHRVSLKQCLAKYLLVKLNHLYDISQANTLDTCNPILWAKETGPSEIWGNSHFLGAGSGANGVCRTKWMGIPCAKKEFHIKESEPFFLNEASILAHLKHPCIVNFICCGNGELKGDRFIAMELMEKSLADLIEEQGAEYFSLNVVVDIMVQIARGMCYLHGQGVAHRDLKPQNVVVNTLKSPHLADHYFVKLVDFGMAKTKIEVFKSNTISSPGVGTTNYRAPEVHPKAHPHGTGKASWFKADVFSFAMTCGHVLSLKKPFGDIILNEVYQHLLDGRRIELHEDCPQELDTLLRNCWDANPCCRPSFVEICIRLEALKHKILRGFPSLQQGESDEFIKVKIDEHSRTCFQGPINSGVEVEDIIPPDLPVRGTHASQTSVEMTQRRRSSF